MQADVSDILAAIPLPAILIRSDERIAAANHAAMQILSPGIEGRHFITALRNPDLLDAVEGCLRDGAARETAMRGSDGGRESSFRVSVQAVPLKDGRGALVSFQDISEAEQVSQMRRDFVANVSHELRTPLTALLGFIETLRGPARDDAAGRARFLDIMQTEAQRMDRLIGDLLSLSRVEANERVRPTQRLNLCEIVTSTARGLAPLAQETGAEIITRLPDDPVNLLGDADQIRQVLTNLTENAIKYSGKNARVTLRLEDPVYEPRLRAQGVRLVIEDNGPGIEAHHIPRLTERFYRVDSHRSREMGGTGLGLAIVKHIVHRHRGRLRIDSTPGQGSRFTVILPVL